MTQPSMAQPPYLPPLQKKRPSVAWFVVGALLVVAGIAIGVTVIVLGLRKVTVTDGIFRADGSAHVVSAPRGERRMVFTPAGSSVPSCTFVDGSGRKLLVRAIFGEATVTTGGTDWQAFGSIDSSGDGKVSATCGPAGGAESQVRMGAPVTVAGLGGTILGGVAALLGLGGLGFAVLLVTTILWVSRKPRTS
jgi:hypothetical protein